MTVLLSPAVKNAMLNQIEAVIGASPKLRIYTGNAPAATDAAATGTLISELTLPADWMADAINGTVSKNGTWLNLSAAAAGSMGYFRILNNAGTVVGLQGTISATGNGGDLIFDSIVVALAQAVEVASFQLTQPN